MTRIPLVLTAALAAVAVRVWRSLRDPSDHCCSLAHDDPDDDAALLAEAEARAARDTGVRHNLADVLRDLDDGQDVDTLARLIAEAQQRHPAGKKRPDQEDKP